MKEKIRNLKAEKSNLQLEVQQLNTQVQQQLVISDSEKSNWQQEIERLNSQIQQQLMISNTDNNNASGSSGIPDYQAKNDILMSLRERIASKYSDDGVSSQLISFIVLSKQLIACQFSNLITNHINLSALFSFKN